MALFLVPSDTGTPGGVVSTPGAAAPARVAACVHKSDIPEVASSLSAASCLPMVAHPWKSCIHGGFLFAVFDGCLIENLCQFT